MLPFRAKALGLVPPPLLYATLPSLEDLFACEKTYDTLVYVRFTFAAANVASRRYPLV